MGEQHLSVKKDFVTVKTFRKCLLVCLSAKIDSIEDRKFHTWIGPTHPAFRIKRALLLLS